uniref:Uncharacterized protein n=1 Tax=Strigops habroptila TaxID=2489341 RepID=A0A672TZY7_STRHB
MPLELVEGGGRGLVEEQGHGACLVGFGHEDGVAPQHHRLVLHLVPVDPSEHLGVPAVGGAVGDAVQEVRVARMRGNAGKRRQTSPPPRARRRTRARFVLGQGKRDAGKSPHSSLHPCSSRTPSARSRGENRAGCRELMSGRVRCRLLALE